jgi:CheY-like chemotaxis protein
MQHTPKILVAGLSPQTLQLAREALEPLDYQIIPSPAMSVALFLAQKNLPELIICDLTMQDGDGLHFLSELLVDEETCNIPFLFMVDEMPGEQMELHALKQGARRVLRNNIVSQEFLEIIKPLIDEGIKNRVKRLELLEE